ncbi:ribbon-helix-helix domain-containing protein [Aquibium microcysteis]|uniref:ribbon-helix-helix domain-containing protein n=1 Tax=Aquibium microcysteis TaxID=675281 RepID=UPI00165D042F|nr:addiction module antitoxin [Aquibium microcysteis]
MSDVMNLNVRISGSLRDFVTETISDGDYESVSEYVRDLIRRDKERAEHEAMEAMKVRLQDAFAVADSEYEYLSADDIRRRALAAR